MEELTLSDFKTCNKSRKIETVWYWEKTDKVMEQNREHINIHSNIYSIDLWQRSKDNIMEQMIVFSINCDETTGHPHAKTVSLDTDFNILHKN